LGERVSVWGAGWRIDGRDKASAGKWAQEEDAC